MLTRPQLPQDKILDDEEEEDLAYLLKDKSQGSSEIDAISCYT